MRKTYTLFPHSSTKKKSLWLCAFPPITRADNPPLHLPKKSESQSELHKQGRAETHVPGLREGIFFHPSLEFVRESDLLSRFQSPETLKRPKGLQLSTWAGGGKSQTDTEEEDVSCHFGAR